MILFLFVSAPTDFASACAVTAEHAVRRLRRIAIPYATFATVGAVNMVRRYGLPVALQVNHTVLVGSL